MSKKRFSKSYEPEEKLGAILAPKRADQKSLILVIEDLQLSRAEKGDLEKWWRVPVSGLLKAIKGEQPYVNIYVSKVSSGANIKAQLEDEERVAAYEQGESEEEGETN